jgi:hypothetical protein
MGVVDDVLKAFDRIPIWRRLQTVPDEIDELKSRLAALEEKLAGKWPADVCRFCGERAVRLSHTLRANDKGVIREEWTCEACGQTDTRSFKVGSR